MFNGLYLKNNSYILSSMILLIMNICVSIILFTVKFVVNFVVCHRIQFMSSIILLVIIVLKGKTRLCFQEQENRMTKEYNWKGVKNGFKNRLTKKKHNEVML